MFILLTIRVSTVYNNWCMFILITSLAIILVAGWSFDTHLFLFHYCPFLRFNLYPRRVYNRSLTLSRPYTGVFGGDGLYAESKIALEVLFNKWHSEGWCVARRLDFAGVVVGWVLVEISR